MYAKWDNKNNCSWTINGNINYDLKLKNNTKIIENFRNFSWKKHFEKKKIELEKKKKIKLENKIKNRFIAIEKEKENEKNRIKRRFITIKKEEKNRKEIEDSFNRDDFLRTEEDKLENAKGLKIAIKKIYSSK